MEFRILGPLEVLDQDEPAHIGGGKRRALLALLLLHANEVVSADVLIDALWRAAPPASPRTALQVLVSDLRKELGHRAAERLETRDAGYVLRVQPLERDSELFERAVADGRDAVEAEEPGRAVERLRAALDLWRGPPLQEFAYDDFAQAEIARLDGLRVDAEEELIEALLALGRHAEGIPVLERLVKAYPDRERLRAQHMLALYRARRQTEALAVFDDARAQLRHRLGVEPGPELRSLQQRVLNHDPALALAGPSPIRRAPRGWKSVAAAAVVLAAVAAAVLAIVRDSGRRAQPTVAALAPHSLAAIDPTADRIVADVRLLPVPRATPLEATDVAVGFGSVWVTDAGEQALLRIDTSSRKLSSPIGIGRDVRALAIGFGSVWVADGNSGTVSRVDPRTRRVAATIPLGSGNASYAITVGAGSVWADAGRFVVRIDPHANRVVERLSVPDVTALAADADFVFCGTQRGTIERIDARVGHVLRLADLQRPVQRLQVVGRALWAVLQGPQFEIWRVDSRDGHVVSTIEVGQLALGLAATPHAVFVPLYREGELVTIAPVQNTISHRLVLRPRLSAVTSGDGLVWVLVA